MKRLCYALAVTLVILIFAGFLIWRQHLPSIGSFVIGKFAGGKVTVSQVNLSYKKGILTADLDNVTMEGNVRGTIKKWKLSLNFRKGLYLDNVTMSDFDLTVLDLKGKKEKGWYSIIPAAFLEARNGTLTYNNERFFVKELVFENIRKGKTFQYRIDVTSKTLFGHLKAAGEGVLEKTLQSMKGRLTIANMGMGTWWAGNMDGIVDGEGSFNYDKNIFSIDGSFTVSRYYLRIDQLAAPVSASVLKGKVLLTHGKDITDIRVRDLLFKNTPFLVNIKLVKNRFSSIDLSSGFLALEDVREYLDPGWLTDYNLHGWDFVEDGTVKIRSLVYGDNNPFNIDLQLKGIRATYKEFAFHDIEGLLNINEERAEISGLRGVYKESMFHSMTVVIPFSKKSTVAKCAYSVNMKDVAPYVTAVKDLSFRDGVTTGLLQAERMKGGEFTILGKGSLQDVAITLKKTPLIAQGAYTFNHKGVSFDPLIIKGGNTDIAISGDWTEEKTELRIKGGIDTVHIQNHLPYTFTAEGVVSVDATILQKPSGFIKVEGTANLDNISYEVPGIIKKERDMKNSARFNVLKDEKGIHVQRLAYKLGVLDLDLKGDLRQDNKMDFDVAMKIDGFEKVARCFFLDEKEAQGNGEVNMAVRNFDPKTGKIPYMKGYINIHNGFLKLPWITKPFKEVHLTSVFKGDSFDISIEKFKCGGSILTKGALHVEGLEPSRFSLSLDMDTLILADFQNESDFKIRSLHHSALLSHTSGNLSLRAKKVKLADLIGDNLEIIGVLADRKLNISEFKVDAFGGNADIHGTVDFSGNLPMFYANGKVTRISGGEVLKAFDAKSHVIDSRGMVYGSLNAPGQKPKEWLDNMNGTLTFYSQDGVIKRWNLLSKIFGLLNVYDFFRGKVDLTKDGLPYKRMGATFLVKDGVFRTDNFLIDSPSMLITGAGDIDSRKKEVDAQITVSPLVTIDTAIGTVPIVRTILKKKKNGFLYVAYDVKGPLDDPRITVSFTDTIGGKALDILKNIMTLPKGVFE